MKRWAICKMLEVEPNDWRPAIASHRVNWRIIHYGSPVWVLCQFAADDLTSVQADVNIKLLPDLTYDTTLGALSTPVRTAALKALADQGFSTTDIKTTASWRQVLNYVGRQIDSTFNCEAGDVREMR